MGWLHTFNLKRKLIGTLTEHRNSPQTAAALARQVNFPEAEISSLLDAMERNALVVRSRLGGVDAYQLNQSQETVAKLVRALDDAQPEAGMTLLQDEHGWVAELSDPAGLLVRGETRQQAGERGRAVMQRLTSTTKTSGSDPDPTTPSSSACR